ncbi:hypothetical protein M3629_12685, partial [Paenibacillus polysaccharolyticus]|uniref:OmpL47-type beta-barrel domain-containing protein n=1 Tax=Paenibacillus polysaccharolyticus TaxID=582692 RepID=UPI002A286EC8|nr:hypothetical protein [Paenibacillus polysaccharolyticus]
MRRKIINILVLFSLIFNLFPYNLQKVSAGFGPPTTRIETAGNQGLNGVYYGPVKVMLTAGSGTQTTEYTIDEDRGWVTYNGPFVLSENRVYVIKYRSVDVNGNKEPLLEEKISVKKDTYSPVTTPIIRGTKGEQEYYTTAVRFELSSKDTQSGVDYSEYSFDQVNWIKYSVPVEVDESQPLIYYRSIDRAGNFEKIKKLKLNIDTTSPHSPSINMNPSGWTNGDVTVTIVDGEDVGSGTSKSQYRTEITENWIDYTVPFKVSSENRTVYARSIDFAGNISDTNNDIVRINRTSPPTPLLNAFEEWTNEEVLVSIDKGNYGLQSPRLEVKVGEGGKWEEYIDPFVVPDEGITTVYARAIDSAGNLSTVSKRTIRYDMTPPSPPDKIEISNLKHDELQLNWSGAKDNIEIANYDIYNDQGELLFTTKETTWIYRDLDPYVMYNFKIIARDHADNTSNFSELIKVTTPIRPSFSSNASFHVNLKSDSSVWTWGENSKGQLGDGTNTSKSKAIQISNLKNIKSVYQGMDFVIAIEKNGTVWGWGGEPINSRKPIKITGFANSKDIKIHNRMIYAFKQDDTVWGWGDIEKDSRNSKIPFGNGTNSSIFQPEAIKELSNVISIEFGSTHALALTKEGSVLTWGYGGEELFGIPYTGKIQKIDTPQVVSSAGKVKKIAIASNSNFVLKDNGLIYGWGNNMLAQLGLGKENRTKKQLVYAPELIPIGSPVKQIETAGFAAFVLTEDGSLYSWGSNGSGEAGVGSTEDYVYVPTRINIQNIKRLVLNEDKTVGTNTPLMALTRDRELWAWGYNDPEGDGGLGVGLPDKVINAPLKVLNMNDTDVVQVTPTFMSAIKQDGSLWMWGRKNRYVPKVLIPKEVKFGDESDTTPPTTPQNLKGFPNNTDVELSWSESTDDKELYHYEIYQDGIFVKSTSDTFITIDSLEPDVEYSFTVRAVDVSGNVSAMSSVVVVKTNNEVIKHNVHRLVASEDQSFSISEDGIMSGWGENTLHGKRGYVSSLLDKLPSITKLARNRYTLLALRGDKTVVELNPTNLEKVVREIKLANVIDISIYSDKYALKEDGTVWRWGIESYSTPQEIKGFYGTKLIEGSLALKSNGEVWQLHGDKPTKLYNLENIIDISTYGQKFIALDKNGTVWAGNAQGNFYRVPNANNIKKVGSGANHFLAIDYSGNVWTWGLNMNGQLGNGKFGAETSTPQMIKQLSNIIDISGGDKHSLALSEDGSIWSWGDNSKGQLGIGTLEMSNVPVKVKMVEKPNIKILKPTGDEYQPTKLSTYNWLIQWIDESWIYSEDSKQQLQILNQNGEIYYDSGEIKKFQNLQKSELVFSEFLPNGRWKIQVREHNGYMWSEWSEGNWIEIEDMKPTVKLVFPAESNNEIELIQARKPLIKWEQKGGSNTRFVSSHIQVLDEKGTVLLDSGEIEQNTTLSSGSWTTSEALPVNQKVQVRVRVKDQQLWSDWSKAGWLKVDPNGQPET